MIKAILIFTVTGLMFLIQLVLISCHSPVIDKKDDTVQFANSDSSKSSEAYQADIDNYRVRVSDIVDANQKLMDSFSQKISDDKRAAQELYRKEIDSLEVVNKTLKRNMNEYRPEGRGKWDTFKIDMTRTMTELSMTVRNLRDTSSK